MPDYQKMYYILCQAADRAIDLIRQSPEGAEQLLRQALAHAEDVYVATARRRGKRRLNDPPCLWERQGGHFHISTVLVAIFSQKARSCSTTKSVGAARSSSCSICIREIRSM